MKLTYGEALIVARTRKSLTRTELAKLVGLASQQTIRNYESGTSVPNVERYFALCIVLDMPANVYMLSPAWADALANTLQRGETLVRKSA